MASIHISAHVDVCGRGFLSLTEALTDTPRFAAQAPPQSITDEFDRFKIWAGNIAAHLKGRRSLEYRLRDAAHLKDETHNLLTALQGSLTDALAIVVGERTPWDELPDSGSDSESDTEPDGLQGDTELKQLSAGIKNTVTCLFRLSMAIRDPAPDSHLRSTITVDKSCYEVYDVQHVKAKFDRDDYLADRLGRAISGRRQYLTYREKHHQKLSKNAEKIGFEEPRTEHTTNSTEATPVPKTGASENLSSVIDDGEDALSQTSYATSVNATIRVPSLPKRARRQEHFQCSLCFRIVAIHSKAAWKRHVFRDLHPYCCTFEHCATADRLYDSSQAWWKHELEAHRTSWQCVEGCERTFSHEQKFTDHVRATHPELAVDSMLSALKCTALKTAGQLDQVSCPLCKAVMTLRNLQKHLGHHQEQLALFALPPNLEETEEDPEEEDSALENDAQQSEDELSEMSDTVELEDQDDPSRALRRERTASLTELTGDVEPSSADDPISLNIAGDEGESYTIKCICGFPADDGNTVLCEVCNTWQHIVCYYDSVQDVPDIHECTDCRPRFVDRRRAIEEQERRKPYEKDSKEDPAVDNRLRSRKNSTDVSPSRSSSLVGSSTTVPSVAAILRALSSANVPNLPSVSTQGAARVPRILESTSGTKSGENKPHWPVSPRLKSPPAISDTHSRSHQNPLLNTNSSNLISDSRKYVTDSGKATDMQSAYERLSEAALLRSGGDPTSLTLPNTALGSLQDTQSSDHSRLLTNHIPSASLNAQKRAYRQRRKGPSCDACRERKVKCDATETTACSECSRRGHECQFTKETNRRVSSIKQVHDLQGRLAELEHESRQAPIVPTVAENEEDADDEGFDGSRELQTKEAWKTLRARREMKDEEQLETLRQRAGKEEVDKQTLIQQPKAQLYQTSRGSRIIVENSRSQRRQSYQNHDADLRQRAKIYREEGIQLIEHHRERTDVDNGPRNKTKLKDLTNDVEAYLQRTSRGEPPLIDQANRAAKRASTVSPKPSKPNFFQVDDSDRSKGSDKQTRVSQSNRTTVTSGGGEIRLRVDASAPLSLQFNGDMEGRTLQINPAEDGMADIVIGNTRGNENTYRSEKGSVLGKNSNAANQARREAEESSVRSGRSSQDRREERGRTLRRRKETTYH